MGVRLLLRSRWPQFILRVLALAVFLLILLTGFIGSPIGSSNLAIMLVWIGWWTALKLFMLPLGGRAWCSICPIPLPGEWLQQGWLIKPGSAGISLGLRWPRFLRNSWIQSAGFALIGLFSAVTLTTPRVTSWIFFGLILTAVAMSLVFEKRIFCRYVCPMGGFIGTYATLAPLELRIRPGEKSGIESSREWTRVCPWINNPAALKANSNCGLCLECLRTTQGDSISINLRPFDTELKKPLPFRLDDAFLSLGLLGSVMVYSAIFLGPWGKLKNAAFDVGTANWWGFAAAFLLISFGAIPAVVAACSSFARIFGKISQSTKVVFIRFSRSLLPLGLFSWIAFTVSFAFSKLAYLWPVFSDPFGWGWNLFGNADAAWQPYLVEVTPWIIVALLVIGLIWTAKSVISTALILGVSVERKSAALPLISFGLTQAVFMMWLLVG